MLTIKKKLAPTWFTLPGDEPASEFLLAPLTPLQFLDVRNEAYKTPAGELQLTGRGALAALVGVRNWRNVFDEKGEAIEFDRRLLEELPLNVLTALALEIANRAALSESERKNSSSPSTAH